MPLTKSREPYLALFISPEQIMSGSTSESRRERAKKKAKEKMKKLKKGTEEVFDEPMWARKTAGVLGIIASITINVIGFLLLYDIQSGSSEFFPKQSDNILDNKVSHQRAILYFDLFGVTPQFLLYVWQFWIANNHKLTKPGVHQLMQRCFAGGIVTVTLWVVIFFLFNRPGQFLVKEIIIAFLVLQVWAVRCSIETFWLPSHNRDSVREEPHTPDEVTPMV